MSRVLDVDAKDTYQELLCPGASRVTLQITNAKVLVGFGVGSPPLYADPDEPYLPIVAGLSRRCDAVRFKHAVAVQNPAAHVTVIAG